MADQEKVVYDLSNGAIFNDPKRLTIQISLFNAEYLGNGTKYRHSYN